MRRLLVLALFAALLFAAAGRGDDPAKKPTPGDSQRVVIPFDFGSQPDDGSYGQTIGDMVWKKIRR